MTTAEAILVAGGVAVGGFAIWKMSSRRTTAAGSLGPSYGGSPYMGGTQYRPQAAPPVDNAPQIITAVGNVVPDLIGTIADFF